MNVVAVLSIVRLTGLAAGNATGEKLPLFVIGKSVKPRCFSGVRSLPCRYRSQKKSWMDGDLFTEWVRELDRKFAAQDRKIALTVDNCPAHPIVDGLKAIELIFLTPNATSKTQPMDQGVIRSLKAFYRNSIINRYVDADEDVVTSEAHLLKNSEIIARVTQTQLDTAEHDDENEKDNVDREMSRPRRDHVRQATEILWSCCLYQDGGEQKMRKKVAEIEKLYEISLLKQKQQSFITVFFKLKDWPFKQTLKDYYKLKTLFFLVPRNVTISNKLFEIKLKGP